MSNPDTDELPSRFRHESIGSTSFEISHILVQDRSSITARGSPVQASAAPYRRGALHSPVRGLAEGDFVILHGRYPGHCLPLNWIVVDIVRMKDGILVEHWDVIQDEATRESSSTVQPRGGSRAAFPSPRARIRNEKRASGYLAV